MHVPLAIVLAVLVLFAAGASLSWLATRLDQLHARVDATLASLQSQLATRAGSAVDLAAGGLLDPATAVLVADAATRARTALRRTSPGDPVPVWSDRPARPIGPVAQSTLTGALHVAFDDAGDVAELAARPEALAVLDDLLDACRRVELARRFHNDAVALARARRRSPVIRAFRLAGHARVPEPVVFQDAVPAGLASVVPALVVRQEYWLEPDAPRTDGAARPAVPGQPGQPD